MPSIQAGTKSSGPTPSSIYSKSPTHLTHADRCDCGTSVGARSECGARAYVAVMIPAGRSGLLPLYFCAHHFRASEDALRKVAVRILDERFLLEDGVAAQKRADHN